MTTLDIFGEGAADRLAELAEAPVEQFQDGGVRLTWDEGSLDLFFTTARRFQFAAYTGSDLLVRLTRIFGTWGLEFEVELMELVPGSPESQRAFERIGFERDGALMYVTPQRLSDYADWKLDGAAEPAWHKELDRGD